MFIFSSHKYMYMVTKYMHKQITGAHSRCDEHLLTGQSQIQM
jgi:hypothetical protein